MKLELILGFLLVLLTTAGMILFTVKKNRVSRPIAFRRITAIARLRGAVGLSVEDGSRVHVSLGNGDLTDAANPSALAGLDTLHRIGQLSSTSDQPSLCTSGSGAMTLLSKDVLRIISTETNTFDSYDANHGHMAGANPLAYALGAMEEMAEPGVKTNVFIGNYGPEAGYLAVAAEEKGAITVAASDSIIAQSVFMAATPNVLFAEELYAVPAYLVYRAAYVASLRVQDGLRLLIGALLLFGAVLKLAGIL